MSVSFAADLGLQGTLELVKVLAKGVCIAFHKCFGEGVSEVSGIQFSESTQKLRARILAFAEACLQGFIYDDFWHDGLSERFGSDFYVRLDGFEYSVGLWDRDIAQTCYLGHYV